MEVMRDLLDLVSDTWIPSTTYEEDLRRVCVYKSGQQEDLMLNISVPVQKMCADMSLLSP